MDKPLCKAEKTFKYALQAEATHAIDYNRCVRRLLAISLLLLFSFPLVSPLLALSANSDANLPACCRRNGVHHCEMRMQRASTSAHQVSVSAIPTKCPFYPRPATLVRHNDARLHASTRLHAQLVHRATVKAYSYASVRVALDTAWQKRGPPTCIA